MIRSSKSNSNSSRPVGPTKSGLVDISRITQPSNSTISSKKSRLRPRPVEWEGNLMKSLYVLAAAALAFFCIQHTSVTERAGAQDAAERRAFVDGEVLVKFKRVVGSASKLGIHQSLGARVETDFGEIGWQHVRLPESLQTNDAIEIYRSDPNVEVAQPNFLYYIQASPNDPMFGQLYGMQRISAPQAWETTTGDPNVVVAVIDTGIDKNHPDLAANVWHNPNEVAGNGIDDDANGLVDDVHGANFAGSNVGGPSDDPASEDGNPDIPRGGEWVMDPTAIASV